MLGRGLLSNYHTPGSTIAAWAECKTVEAWSYQSCYATCLTPLEDVNETCDANVKMPDSRVIIVFQWFSFRLKIITCDSINHSFPILLFLPVLKGE